MSKTLFNTNTFQNKNVTNSNNIDNSVDIKNATIDTAVIENIVNSELQGKQDALTTGDGIDITNNQISFDGTISQDITTNASNSITAGTLNYIDSGVVKSVQREIGDKQDALTAGTNISISPVNVISATDTNTTYTAATNGGLSLSGTEFSVNLSNTNTTFVIPQLVHIEKDGTPQLLVEPASNNGNDGEIEIRGARNQTTSTFVSRLRFSNYDRDIATTQYLGEISARIQDPVNNLGGLYFSHFTDGSTRGTGATMNYKGNWRFGPGFQDTYKVQIDGNTQINGTLGITGFSNVRTAIEDKQDALTAGNNISIVGNVISATDNDTTYTAGTNVSISAGNVISATDTDTTYTAGTNVSISAGNVISATDNDTTYTAGTNVSISAGNVISATDTDTTYTAGTNVSISAGNEISASDTNTTYTAATNGGLSLSGTEFSLDLSTLTATQTLPTALELSSTLQVTGISTFNGNVYAGSNILVTGTNKVLGVDDTGVGYIKIKNNGTGGVIQFNNADDKLDIQYTANNIMSIEPDKVRLYKNLIPDTAVLDIGSTSSRFQTGNFLIANASTRIESQTYRATDSTQMLFQNSSGTTRMVLTDQGKLGIQTTAPGQDLTVNGDAGIVEGLTVGGNTYIKQGLILDPYDMGETTFTNGTDDDAASSTSRENIYIKFAPGSDVANDWVYLRNIGGSNLGHLAFDFHDDNNDVRFSIRNIRSSGFATDVIESVFEVLSTGVTANTSIYRTPQMAFYNFGQTLMSNNQFGNGNRFVGTSSIRETGTSFSSHSNGTITISEDGYYKLRVGANPVSDGYNDRLAFCVYLLIGSTEYFQNRNYNFHGYTYTRNSSDGAFGNINFEDYIYITRGTIIQVRTKLDTDNRNFDNTLSNTQMECYCHLQIERIAETDIS